MERTVVQECSIPRGKAGRPLNDHRLMTEGYHLQVLEPRSNQVPVL